jgi:ribosomal protein L13E
MTTITDDKKIRDMTAKELQDLIRETIWEILDPDYSLELRPEVQASLRKSRQHRKAGRGFTIEEVREKLNI